MRPNWQQNKGFQIFRKVRLDDIKLRNREWLKI